jgi:hypothetical protein
VGRRAGAKAGAKERAGREADLRTGRPANGEADCGACYCYGKLRHQ